jgi:N-carbamoyl-L-amino-acid hydrolase
MFALYPGTAPELPPIALGSHLDTQPTGGKYDGNLGVLSALEVVRTLKDAGYSPRAPLVICNWTNEEGARFAPACMGSRVFAGALTREEAEASADRSGTTFGQAIREIGYVGEAPIGGIKFSGYFELHIEQGPVLEAEEKTIGVVHGIQGQRWYEVTLRGRESHAGTTPMPLRKDALLAASEIICRIADIAREQAPSSVGTVGLIEARPNSRNVVPGEVFFSVDLRNPIAHVIDTLEKNFYSVLEETRAQGFDIEVRKTWDQPPIAFDEACIAAVREAATASGLPMREMVSGAGHDAGYISTVAPTAMIFVPCKDGISHNEDESATKQDCAAGAQILLDAVLRYDEKLSR